MCRVAIGTAVFSISIRQCSCMIAQHACKCTTRLGDKVYRLVEHVHVIFDHLTTTGWSIGKHNIARINRTTDKFTSLNIMYSMILPIPEIPALISVRHTIDAMNVSL